MAQATQDRLLSALRSVKAATLPRIITLTMPPSAQLGQNGRLQEALLLRLRVETIRFSALSHRKAEIPGIAAENLAALARRLGEAAPDLGADAPSYLKAQGWTADLHELESVLLACLLTHTAGTAFDG